MDKPRTLLEMAGAKLTPPPPAELTMVLIDMQMEYVDGKLPLPGAKPAIAAAARLLERLRQLGRPIVHIRHKGRAGTLFDPDGPGFAIAPALAPAAGETVLSKGLPNSFAGTELDATLKRLGAKQVLYAGFMTHMCISSTVRAALDLGYASVVASDACATRDLPDGQGGAMAADLLHRAELASLADRFAIVAPTAAILG